MAWVKRGLVFDPGVHAPWIFSHAQVPTAFEMDEHIRVFFAGRNQDGKSFMTYVDLDKSDPTKILYVHDRPIIALGRIGTFDDEGMMPSDVVDSGGRVCLFYSGWNQRKTIPYHNTTGVLVSDDGAATFSRLFEGPILDRIPTEPYGAVTPTVLIENGLWRMWYVSGTSWEVVNGQYESLYVIKYAHSENGVDWVRTEGVCIKPKHELEACSRPSVVRDGGIFRMWYSSRSCVDFRGGKGSYRLGYAESLDGIEWCRKDEALGLTVSSTGWDSEMQCYPYVIDVSGKRYMFYNGNGFGRGGFGLAEWLDGE